MSNERVKILDVRTHDHEFYVDLILSNGKTRHVLSGALYEKGNEMELIKKGIPNRIPDVFAIYKDGTKIGEDRLYSRE